jgi:hypothetical protein
LVSRRSNNVRDLETKREEEEKKNKKEFKKIQVCMSVPLIFNCESSYYYRSPPNTKMGEKNKQEGKKIIGTTRNFDCRRE